jgi:hypothetical protein
MIETIELRVRADQAHRLFAEREGKVLGPLIRKVVIGRHDPRVQRIVEVQREFKSHNEYFYAGWRIQRKYTADEIDNVRLFQLHFAKGILVAGELFGTLYDDSRACPVCGALGMQVSELVIQHRHLPRRGGMASTLAGEWLIEERTAAELLRGDLTGFRLSPVGTVAASETDPFDLQDSPTGRSLLRELPGHELNLRASEGWEWLNRSENRPLLRLALEEHMGRVESARKSTRTTWFQLKIGGLEAQVAAGTEFGPDPFDPAAIGSDACSLCHMLGSNQLSQLRIVGDSWSQADFALTSQYVGVRRGVFRPRQMILLSRKAFEVLHAAATPGVRMEPVTLV